MAACRCEDFRYAGRCSDEQQPTSTTQTWRPSFSSVTFSRSSAHLTTTMVCRDQEFSAGNFRILNFRCSCFGKCKQDLSQPNSCFVALTAETRGLCLMYSYTTRAEMRCWPSSFGVLHDVYIDPTRHAQQAPCTLITGSQDHKHSSANSPHQPTGFAERAQANRF